MPLLAKEIDLYPDDLLEFASHELATRPRSNKTMDAEDRRWWALYTLSRREKQLMRRLVAMEVPFYSPVIERRYRSPAGRARVSYELLFRNYVFIYGTESQRYAATTTNCLSRWMPVVDGQRLTRDLGQIQRLVESGAPLTPESRLVAGDRVRVRSGAFAGFEGIVIRRHGEQRLLLSVDFARQGASVLLDDCQIEPV